MQSQPRDERSCELWIQWRWNCGHGSPMNTDHELQTRHSIEGTSLILGRWLQELTARWLSRSSASSSVPLLVVAQGSSSPPRSSSEPSSVTPASSRNWPSPATSSQVSSLAVQPNSRLPICDAALSSQQVLRWRSSAETLRTSSATGRWRRRTGAECLEFACRRE